MDERLNFSALQHISPMAMLVVVSLVLSTGCDSRYDVTGFRFVDEGRYVSQVRIVDNEHLRIYASNIWGSGPNTRPELGIDTYVSIRNYGSVEVVIDSVRVYHFFEDIDVSGSDRIKWLPPDQDLFPILLCSYESERRCQGLSIDYYVVVNSDLEFQLGDMVDVDFTVWYSVEGEQNHLNTRLQKVYRRERGFMMP